MSDTKKWERVATNTRKLQVEGGYLYEVAGGDPVFVPDPAAAINALRPYLDQMVAQLEAAVRER